MRIIPIEPAARAKPPPGDPCNGCGLCCLYEPCPLGVLLFRKRKGSCQALVWDAQRALYRCGALVEPSATARHAIPPRLHFLVTPVAFVLRHLARRWIAAGTGCDSTLEPVPSTEDNSTSQSTLAPKPMHLPIAITMGDAAGIGPEIIAKLYFSEPALSRGTFVAGDVQTMREASALLSRTSGDLPMPVLQLSAAVDALDCPAACIPVLPVGPALGPTTRGRISPVAGEYAGRCIFWAADAAMRGEIAAMVTAPIQKEALHAAGEPYSHYPGHTEMLQAAAAAYLKKPLDQLPVRMMLANDELRVVLVSIHVSLRDALAAVTLDNVLQTLLITHMALGELLGRAPRIAVAGLNPHAGEGGLFGREELDVIAPAVALARKSGCNAMGPMAPDTVFMRARRSDGADGEFDAVVAMYHDQGLIPVKYLGVQKGVNVTLGLPIVRTSPDHGTAYDIAGQGTADPASLIEAVRVARSLLTS